MVLLASPGCDEAAGILAAAYLITHDVPEATAAHGGGGNTRAVPAGRPRSAAAQAQGSTPAAAAAALLWRSSAEQQQQQPVDGAGGVLGGCLGDVYAASRRVRTARPAAALSSASAAMLARFESRLAAHRASLAGCLRFACPGGCFSAVLRPGRRLDVSRELNPAPCFGDSQETVPFRKQLGARRCDGRCPGGGGCEGLLRAANVRWGREFEAVWWAYADENAVILDPLSSAAIRADTGLASGNAQQQQQQWTLFSCSGCRSAVYALGPQREKGAAARQVALATFA